MPSGTPSVIASIAEQRIAQAMERGDFDDLPGAGKPLDLAQMHDVPEDLRMAYHILRNAGYLPPELEERKEINTLVEMLERCTDEAEKVRQMQKLNCLLLRINVQRARPVHLEENDPYYAQILERVRVVQKGMKTGG